MNCMQTRTLKKLLAPSLLTLAMFAGATQAAAPLRPPQGYFAPIEKVKTGDKSEGCDAMPTPYTGALQFRSKYEGSDKARSTLNEASEKAFRDTTADITKIERATSKRVMQFMRDGRPEQLECTLNWLTPGPRPTR
jgi:Alginate lyase.